VRGTASPPACRTLLALLLVAGDLPALAAPLRWAAAPLSLGAAAARPAPATAPTAALAQVQELLDAGRAPEALARLEPIVRAEPRNAAALLLRSTALFMTGDLPRGRADLERSLALDPRQRQGWLNLAAVHLADGRHDLAYQAMATARDLDPSAPENELNLGAVELLRGRVAEASAHFRTYLERNAGSADASYLVSTNYAMAGLAALATQHLARAIELDERVRLRARTDRNFAALATQPAFERLLATDSWQAPPGSYRAQRVYPTAYDAADGTLLQATLDALQLGRHSFDPAVEVTPAWALLWGEMRIKLANGPDGGVVELTAPAERFTPAEWQQRSERLLAEIATRLVVREAAKEAARAKAAPAPPP
jgi:tetratricopeptide (TPR) repeat protein